MNRLLRLTYGTVSWRSGWRWTIQGQAVISAPRLIKSKVKKEPQVRRVFEDGRVRTITLRSYDQLENTHAHP